MHSDFNIQTRYLAGSDPNFNDVVQMRYGNCGTHAVKFLMKGLDQSESNIEFDQEKEIFRIADFSLNHLRERLAVLAESADKKDLYFLKGWAPKFFIEKEKFFFALSPLGNISQRRDLFNHFIEKMELPSCKEVTFSDEKQRPFILPEKLILPSGKEITYKEFSNHPLFKDSQSAKKCFFSDLAPLCSSTDWRDYNLFLNRLSEIDFDLFRLPQQYKKLACYSLIAFLDGKIDQEELFILHIAAEALSEIYVRKVNFHFLTSQNAADYLREAGFAPFASQVSSCIKNSKTQDQLEKEKSEFLKELSQSSLIKRTAIEYTLSSFRDNSEKSSLEMGIYFRSKFTIGYKNIKGSEGTVVLLSPQLSINLLRRTSALSFSDPEYRFGYSKDDSPFYRGVRVVSIPSPSFGSDYVHGYGCGPKGLGLYHHDISYHMVLEANNPHVNLIVNLAKKIKAYAETFNPYDSRRIFWNQIASKAVDREAVQYCNHSPKEAFDIWLDALIHVYTSKEKSILNSLAEAARKEINEGKDGLQND